jgi:hypothetical protein
MGFCEQNKLLAMKFLVCVCVCERERERDKEMVKEREHRKEGMV